MPDIALQTLEKDHSFSGYIAFPERSPAPAILVIQEIFGVNKVMRTLCDHYAAQGYIALCPDLFWRQEPNIQITDQSDAEWQKAFTLFQGFDKDKGIDDLKASLSHLRSLEQCTGKVGSVGYCLGGFLAYLMTCRSDADANIGYYPVAVADHLEEASQITTPLMLHRAGQDEFVPADALEAVKTALKSHAFVTLHDYPDQGHAFARVGGKHYDPSAAQSANDRSQAFLKSYLG